MNQVTIGKLRRLSGREILRLLPFDVTVDDKVVAVVCAPGETPASAELSRHFPPRRVRPDLMAPKPVEAVAVEEAPVAETEAEPAEDPAMEAEGEEPALPAAEETV